MRDQGFKFIVILPLLGICCFMAQAQYRASVGEVYRVKIKGYDPRDLLRGHYLRYRFEFRERLLDPSIDDLNHSHDYCFIREASEQFQIMRILTEEGGLCTSRMKSTELDKPQKYFIPEAHAKALEASLRHQNAEVDLIINLDGHYSVGQLYLDGVPWEESVIK